MLQIQLYVDGQEVELYKDESVTLTQSIQDILDIEKVFTDYSKTFNVPASKSNNKLFKHFYNYHIDGFDARNKKAAQLHLNYKEFKKGFIKLEGAQLKNNEPQSYKLTFFGNTVTLNDTFGEDKLSGLDQLNSFSFDYTDSNIETYMTNGFDNNIGPHDITDGLIVPLITHTDRLIYDSSDTTAGTNNVYHSLLHTTAVRGVKFNQLKPAIRLYAIIKAIELKYDLKFSEDFFTTTNLPFFNIYMWLHTKEGGIFADQDSQYIVNGFTNPVGAIQEIKGVRTDSFVNTYDDRKNKRTAQVKVDPSGSDEYNLVIKKDGEEYKRFDNLTNTTTNGVASGPVDIELEKGTYSFYIESDAASTYDIDVTILNDPTSFFQSQKKITFSGTATIGSDEHFEVASQMPDMKVVDFLSGLWKMFNLTSYVNDEGIIVVQPLNDYYSSSPNTWDITEYVDKTESIVDAVIPFNEVSMVYGGKDTFLAKNHLSLGNKGWGDLNYKLTDDRGELYKLEVPFEHMKYERLYDTDGTESNVMFGWSVDSKQQSTVGKPLLFYAVRPIATVAAVNIAGQRKNIASPYTPSNSQLIDRSYGFTDARQSLNFAAEYDEYDGHTNEKTLFKTYYEDYIVDLFDKRKRLTFVSAYLPMSVTEKLTLADKIVVFDKLYRINKLTTNFETNKSELELTNILDETLFVNSTGVLQIDLSDILVTTDSTTITTDVTNVTADGFTRPPETEEIPATEEIQSNDITPPSDDACEVTAATITTGASQGFCNSIKFSSTITTPGKLCGRSNIDEYGFLIASVQSYLTASDDIDTLKADSNITVVSVARDYQNNQSSLSAGIKQTVVTSLNDPETRFARFYVKTNINTDEFDEADSITSVMSGSTDCGSSATADNAQETADDTNTFTADAGDTDGDGTPEASATKEFIVEFAGTYSSEPTIDDVVGNTNTNIARGGGCGAIVPHSIYYHNGAGETPVVGDSIREFRSQNYSGGTSSFYWYDSSFHNRYAAISYGSSNEGRLQYQHSESQKHVWRYDLTVTKFIVVDFTTAKVLSILTCPAQVDQFFPAALHKTHVAFYDGLIERYRVCGQSVRKNRSLFYGKTIENFEHNGISGYPQIGEKIKQQGDAYDYTGGANSFSSTYREKEYFILTVLGTAQRQQGYLNVKLLLYVRVSDATVVDLKTCVL